MDFENDGMLIVSITLLKWVALTPVLDNTNNTGMCCIKANGSDLRSPLCRGPGQGRVRKFHWDCKRHVSQTRLGPGQAGPGRAGPGRARLSRAGPGWVRPGRAGTGWVFLIFKGIVCALKVNV